MLHFSNFDLTTGKSNQGLSLPQQEPNNDPLSEKSSLFFKENGESYFIKLPDYLWIQFQSSLTPKVRIQLGNIRAYYFIWRINLRVKSSLISKIRQLQCASSFEFIFDHVQTDL